MAEGRGHLAVASLAGMKLFAASLPSACGLYSSACLAMIVVA